MTPDQGQGQILTQPTTATPAATTAAVAPELQETKPFHAIARGAVTGLLLLFALLNWVPWQPAVIPNEVDGSWGLALQWAFLHHLDFGHQFVFTFGPWGFIWQGALAGTHRATVFAWVALTIIFTLSVSMLGKEMIKHLWLRYAWVALIVLLTCLPVELIQDVRLMGIAWLLLLTSMYGARRESLSSKWLALGLFLAVAFASQVKFSTAVLALPVVVIACVHDSLRRRLPWGGIIYVGGFVAFWLAAHQRLSSLWPYLYHSTVIVSGYSQGAGLRTPDESLEVLEFAMLCVWLFASVAKGNWTAGQTGNPIVGPTYARLSVRMLALLGLAISLLLCFKVGYIRHDEHEEAGDLALAVLAFLYLPILLSRLKHTMSRGMASALVFLSLALVSDGLGRFTGHGLIESAEMLLASQPSQLSTVTTWFAGKSDIERQFQTLQASSSLPPLALPPISEGIDEFGCKQWMLISEGRNYQPRPVMQPYLAYEPQISQLNADFLAGAQASENLLLDIAPIDWHYPSMEDSLAWPQIIRCYEPVEELPGYLLLRHARRSRSFSLQPLGGTVAQMQTPIAVPDSSNLIWATIAIDLTPAGRLLKVLYKNPPLDMAIRTADGKAQHFLLIPDMARAGFILSPEMISRATFSSLCANPNKLPAAAARVVALEIEDDSGSLSSYQSKFRISFFRMAYSME